MTPAAVTIRRILVALDASPSSFVALEAAARLASALEADLYGLFVEDEALLRCAELPGARVVGSYSGLVQPIARKELEEQLRTRADRARRALEGVAERSRLRWSFRVARGGVTSEVLSAAAESDLISLGRFGWSLVGKRQVGTTTQSVLERAAAPVLLLDREPHLGQAIVAVYDGSAGAGRGLVLGHRLALGAAASLVVGLLASNSSKEELERQARQEIEGLAAKLEVQYRELGNEPLKTLEGIWRQEGIGFLILPAATVRENGIPGLLSRLKCPILVVE